jgi:glycosyltransferase involved in cell wall biosynthesis
MNKITAPLIGLGMPVFNGAEYIAGAIESIINQSISDFELIICDNASTDDTEAICRKFAQSDKRIHYYRNEQNIGAHPNYNKTFELTSGKYFKWTPHDDLLHPDFLKECIQAMEDKPESVVSQSYLQYIDENDEKIGVYDSKLTGSDSPLPMRRLASLLLTIHPSYEIMGVFRRSALDGTKLLQSFHGADRALLAELALRGTFNQIQKPLQLVRDHKERYSRAQVRPRDRANWHDARLTSRFSFPTWKLYGEYWTFVWRHTHSLKDKLGCYLVLIAWWGKNWNAVRMLVDVIAVLVPDATRYAELIKQKLFSPAPGADEVDQGSNTTQK